MLKSLVFGFLFISSVAFAHDDGEQPITTEPAVQETVTTSQYVYRFQLFDTVNRRVIDAANLEIEHEQLIHFVVYDPALREFQHVHPTFDGQYWNVTLNFAVSGNYWLWSQGKIKGGDEFTSSTRLEVTLDQPAWPSPPVLTESRMGNDGTSQVMLGSDTLYSGKMAMLDLMFSRTDGTAPVLTPYLGALAHVTAVTQDGDSLVHVHPMATKDPNMGMLHVDFPSAGFYRIWIEYIDGGTLKRVALAVEVH